MRTKIVFVGIFSVVALLFTVYLFIKQSVFWYGITEQSINVYSSEFDAAYEGSLNRPNGKPLVRLAQGENIDVLTDTYGKDYWACYVSTSKGVRGWVLCTLLKKIDKN